MSVIALQSSWTGSHSGSRQSSSCWRESTCVSQGRRRCRQALALIGAHRPDVFVTGIEMVEGEIDGIECITRARSLVPDLRSVVLSAHTDTEYIDKALDAGAVAYVIKSAHPDDLTPGRSARLFQHSRLLRGVASGTGADVRRPPRRAARWPGADAARA